MEYRVLGPLEVIDDDVVVALNAAKPRALLAMLLLRANEFVSNDRLIDDLWEDKPPATAGKVLQTYISQLRRTLGQEVIETGPGGYRLRVDPERVDLLRFRRLVADGRGGEREEVASRLREALALWRGEPLVEFSHQAWARGEAERLDAVRLDAVERRIEADLAAGRDHGLARGGLRPLAVGLAAGRPAERRGRRAVRQCRRAREHGDEDGRGERDAEASRSHRRWYAAPGGPVPCSRGDVGAAFASVLVVAAWALFGVDVWRRDE